MKLNLPYASLRTFEAVARLKSFGRAASELGVSQSAVSQHVKGLEKWTGTRLMRRGGGTIEPTEAGQQLAHAVSEGFGAVAARCSDLRAIAGRRPGFVLACPTGLAQMWLLPLLPGFDGAFPGVPLSVCDLVQGALPPDSADIGVHYGANPPLGRRSERLLSESLVPVCAPSLLRAGPALAGPEDLEGHVLLHDDLCGQGVGTPLWHVWARQNAIALPRQTRSRSFASAEMAVAAAVEGLGVALGRRPLVDRALAAGALVIPFGLEVPSGNHYWLTQPTGDAALPRVEALCAWLREAAAR
jgi:LysR family glycine cleavage system transcriptional activator